MIIPALGALVAGAVQPAVAGHDHGHSGLKTVVELDGPRGVANVGHGKTLVAESDGTVSLVIERRHRHAKVIPLTSVSSGGFAPAIDNGKHHRIFIVTGAGAPDDESAATLYRWTPGHAKPYPLADIAAYQQSDPDPYDTEDFPEDSNPFGVAALKSGGALVADAAGNDLLRVKANGDIYTVARIKTRVVKVPQGLPPEDPEGNPLPPAGTPIPAEGVATSVTVGADGYYYVGELRGFPATPGTSEIWRINPHARNAVCDPVHPNRGACQRYAGGLTSIVDLAADRHGNIYALELSKKSWLKMELGVPGSEIGGLFKISRHGHRIHELAKNKLTQPGGVDVSRHGSIYITGPVFGPGALYKLHQHR